MSIRSVRFRGTLGHSGWFEASREDSPGCDFGNWGHVTGDVGLLSIGHAAFATRSGFSEMTDASQQSAHAFTTAGQRRACAAFNVAMNGVAKWI